MTRKTPRWYQLGNNPLPRPPTMNVKDSPLYKSLCKSVRKQDHAELLRMLEMVPQPVKQPFSGFNGVNLGSAFEWSHTPQGALYWHELHRKIVEAGGYD